MSARTRPGPCGLCGKPATGLASIDGTRYCHGDDDAEPTCYEQAQWGDDPTPEQRLLLAIFGKQPTTPTPPKEQR